MLYKPAGLKLTEMRIEQERYPEKLYMKRIDKLRGIREVQKEFNLQLKKDIQSNNAIPWLTLCRKHFRNQGVDL